MSKFQRAYRLTVQGRFGTTYTFQEPLTVVFDINTRATGDYCSAHFLLYNLSPVVRNDIEFDSAIDIDGIGATFRRALVFNAGYVSESILPVLFQGDVSKAFSYRDGPDVVTDITANSGLTARQRAQIMYSRAAGWKAEAEVAQMVQTMSPYGVKLGAIGSLFRKHTATRGVTWLGSTWDVIKKLAAAQGGYACINQGKVFVMGPNDVLPPLGTIDRLDATTGLIGTPRRTAWTVDAQMIFEPRVQLLQQLVVKSNVARTINGTFSVQAIGHRGIISGAKDGGVITAFSLVQPPNALILVAQQ